MTDLLVDAPPLAAMTLGSSSVVVALGCSLEGGAMIVDGPYTLNLKHQQS